MTTARPSLATALAFALAAALPGPAGVVVGLLWAAQIGVLKIAPAAAAAAAAAASKGMPGPS